MLIGGSPEGRLSHARDFRARFFLHLLYIYIYMDVYHMCIYSNATDRAAGVSRSPPREKDVLCAARRNASFVAPLCSSAASLSQLRRKWFKVKVEGSDQYRVGFFDPRLDGRIESVGSSRSQGVRLSFYELCNTYDITYRTYRDVSVEKPQAIPPSRRGNGPDANTFIVHVSLFGAFPSERLNFIFFFSFSAPTLVQRF